ncbi:hypothetical protein KKH24_02845 [Patescibacteria group bacterium]|nr:hypothetical protein [Patescibacteria group bacterium]
MKYNDPKKENIRKIITYLVASVFVMLGSVMSFLPVSAKIKLVWMILMVVLAIIWAIYRLVLQPKNIANGSSLKLPSFLRRIPWQNRGNGYRVELNLDRTGSIINSGGNVVKTYNISRERRKSPIISEYINTVFQEGETFCFEVRDVDQKELKRLIDEIETWISQEENPAQREFLRQYVKDLKLDWLTTPGRVVSLSVITQQRLAEQMTLNQADILADPIDAEQYFGGED